MVISCSAWLSALLRQATNKATPQCLRFYRSALAVKTERPPPYGLPPITAERIGAFDRFAYLAPVPLET